MKATLYWHTVRALRFEQLAFRLPNMAIERIRGSAGGLIGSFLQRQSPAASGIRELSRKARGLAVVPPSVLDAARADSNALRGFFSFGGDDAAIDPPVDWLASSHARLWRYHLHYLDDLRPLALLAETGDEDAMRCGRALVADWIAQNPPVRGEGWEPYPASVRLQNLLAWCAATRCRDVAVMESLSVHCTWIRLRLERHLLGNHLLKNLCALLLWALLVDSPQAGGIQAFAEARLQAQLGEQVLSDGGHVERSPMYHLIVVEDLLSVDSAWRGHPGGSPAWFRTVVQHMLDFVPRVLHPDGEIALLNDSSFGQAAHPDELASWASTLGYSVPILSKDDWRAWLWCGHSSASVVPPEASDLIAPGASGVATVVFPRGKLIFDAGSLGEPHLLGHAHSDTLSFELSLDGRRVVVDGGNSGYDGDEMRPHFRSVRAHNTVEVDGHGADEMWATFRVARRSRVTMASAERRGAWSVLRGTVRSPFGWQHARTIVVIPDAGLIIFDRVDGVRGEATARIHLHPDRDVEAAGSAIVVDGHVRIEPLLRSDVTVARGLRAPLEGWYGERFGRVVPASVILIRMTGRRVVSAVTVIRWADDVSVRREMPSCVRLAFHGQTAHARDTHRGWLIVD